MRTAINHHCLPILAFTAVAMATSSVGCTPDPKSGKGFTLPVGDMDRGQATFVQMQCTACHTIPGVDFEKPENAEDKMIVLGGTKATVTTYGDLVTSIINPSHRFAAGYREDDVSTEGQSNMRIYNDEMTVTQLTDLVTFLEERYEVRAYQPHPYMPYY